MLTISGSQPGSFMYFSFPWHALLVSVKAVLLLEMQTIKQNGSALLNGAGRAFSAAVASNMLLATSTQLDR